jgi:hypothetical protein
LAGAGGAFVFSSRAEGLSSSIDFVVAGTEGLVATLDEVLAVVDNRGFDIAGATTALGVLLAGSGSAVLAEVTEAAGVTATLLAATLADVVGTG